MIVIPAIDLKRGKCVRLSQGRSDQETVYYDDPAEVARRFAADGAKMLHLVDLDGAFSGETGNLEAIKAVRKAIDLPIELGGGLRSPENIAGMFALGIDSVIVGTMAVDNPELFEEALKTHGAERIQLGVDARNGYISVRGWEQDTPLDAISFAHYWRDLGVTRAIFTDISRDGMMTGPNLNAIRKFVKGSRLLVTASGGVSNAQDLAELAELEVLGVDRVIVGKAIYEGTVKLSEVV